MSEIFKYRLDADGVAILTWDLPGKSMNVLTEPGIRELDAGVDRALTDPAVKGVVITSAKKDFAGGMDLNVIATMKERTAKSGGNPAEAVFDFTMELHALLRKIERAGADPRTGKGGKPFVWAAPGSAAGIGTEIALACHHRIAADNSSARIGLPEIRVGIFPGAGGATRLVRMLGLMGAAPFLLGGKMVAPAAAKDAGLIDDVVPTAELLRAAKAWIMGASEADVIKPWDKKGFRLPGGAPYSPEGMLIYIGGVAMAHGKTQGVYPAARAMLSAIYEGAMVDFDTAIRIEARWFANVLMNPSSTAMIRSLFVNKRAIEKGSGRPAGAPDMQVRKLGVLGAGMMGAGIAFVAARAGIEVALLDRDQAACDRGREAVKGLLDADVKRKKISPEARAETLARLTATPDYDALKGCDLIIEAVFEDPGVKAAVTREAEARLGEAAIFATNTSTLPVTGLARASARPERFIGIHFFSPVHQMMLVEVIKGEKTGDAAVAKALDFARQIRKTPIMVNDARFFYANRCILPYVNEGVRMLTEGVEPALIENAARQFGMPLGPLQLTDEISLDLGWKIAQATRAAMGDAYPESPADAVLEEMVEKRERPGRKSNAGFYAYDEKGKRRGLWPELREIWPVADTQPSLEDVRNRLALAQVLEAVRALEENVLLDIREGDVGAILGWGFAPWSGGPLSWIDITGPARVVALCDALTAACGSRFEAPPLLRNIADKGQTFYGRFTQPPAATT